MSEAYKFDAAQAFTIHREAVDDICAREALLDIAMGPGRKRKSSEKIRKNRQPADGLALVAKSETGALLGTVRLWHVRIASNNADYVDALLLGPLAVSFDAKGQGVGSALMRHAIREAKRLGHGAILLVGDPEYYSRFGFSAEKTYALTMPGPFEKHRFQALELVDRHLDNAIGILRASGRKMAVEVVRPARVA